MPDNLLLYGLLVLALGIGFLFGRAERLGKADQSGGTRRGGGRSSALAGTANGLPAHYYQGLNYLLDERHELAIDALIEQLEVTPETLATHLALGALLRRRGEHDKAIRVHQNLLATTRLSTDAQREASLELARDFLAAGLLGRAETLLKDQPAEGKGRLDVLRLLLDVYVRERDWDAALPLAQELADSPEGRSDAAHIACELAEARLAEGNHSGALKALESARRSGLAEGRVQLMMARLALADKDTRGATKALRRSLAADPDLVGELLPLYREATLAVNDEASYLGFLNMACASSDDAPVEVEALSEQAQFIERDSGSDAAQQFLVERLVKQPSLAGLIALLELVEERGLPREQLAAVLQYCRTFLAGQPSFRCANCGFRAQHRHWLCPSCRRWGQHRAMRNYRSERPTH